MQSDNSLMHHGILGMKWGVRNYQPYPKGQGHKGVYKGNPTSQSKKATKPTTSSNRKIAAKTMTDQELRQRINRIEMERKYAQLTAPQKSAGSKFVRDVISNAGKQVATQYTAKAMTSVVEKTIKSKIKK